MGTWKYNLSGMKLGGLCGSRGLLARLASGFLEFSNSPAGLFPPQCGLKADVSSNDHHVGAAAARRSRRGRRRLSWALFFSPIRALAQTGPVLRTSVPPMSLLWAPNMCSTRARTWSGSCCPAAPARSAACCDAPCGESGSSGHPPPASPRTPPTDRRFRHRAIDMGGSIRGAMNSCD